VFEDLNTDFETATVVHVQEVDGSAAYGREDGDA
jgi:hypothetical protein